MKALVMMLGACGAAVLPAAEVRWTARGTVSSISGGAAFSETGAAAGNAVEIVMSYDSQALVDGRSFLPIGDAIAGRAWFHGPVNLGITVKIGANTWTGEMPTVPDANVMESVCWDFAGSPDTFTVTLNAARGGTFPSFPHTGDESNRVLKLEFRDDTAPAELFDVHVLPDSLTRLCEMTSATGAVQAGTSILAFSLDPKSVNVTLPQVPVTLATTTGGILLSWPTQAGKSYRIEGSSDLRCWSSEGVFFGNGNLKRETLTPFEIYPKRFYRVAEL